MSVSSDMSRTMRIDLIPDVPNKPLANKQRVVIKQTATGDTPAVNAALSELSELAGMSRYQELLESIYDAAVMTDLKGMITDVNSRAIQFLQWSKAEMEGVFVGDVIVGADNVLVDSLWRNLERQRFTLIQAYCIRKDGTVFPTEISVNRLRRGNGNLCFFIRDITLRRQAEEMLRTEHNAIQNAANGIAIANLAGVLEYANPAFAAMIDSTESEELVGTSIYEMFEGSDMVQEMFYATLQEDRRWNGEVSIETHAGRVVDLEILASPNRNSDGEKVGIVLSFSDLSDRKRAEGAMREAERQRVMIESLGAACHHLAQPATVLMANLGMIRSKIGNEDTLLSEMINSSIDAMRRMGDTLHKLNCVNEYRTTSYMGDDTNDSPRSRILEI